MKFMNKRWLYFSLSGLVLGVSLFSLWRWGLKLGVDFAGGDLWEISFSEAKTKAQLEEVLKNKKEFFSLQQSEEKVFLIRSATLNDETRREWSEEIKAKVGPFQERRLESLGPSLGRELLIKALTGVVLAVLGILLYVSLRFKDRRFGICAILAMLHDSFILLGSFSLLGHFLGVEVDGLFVTAFLTTLSFSVHDTVVVYDRIRELRRFYPKLSFSQIADLAVTETLVRSINNSMTIIFVLLALFLLGGESTRWFAFALLVGTVAGTYSSTFTAVPLLVTWYQFSKK